MMSTEHTVAVQFYVPEPKKIKGKPVPGQPDYGRIAQAAVSRIQRALPNVKVDVFKSNNKFVHLCGQPDAVHKTCLAILNQVEYEMTPKTDGKPAQPGERYYVSEGCD